MVEAVRSQADYIRSVRAVGESLIKKRREHCRFRKVFDGTRYFCLSGSWNR